MGTEHSKNIITTSFSTSGIDYPLVSINWRVFIIVRRKKGEFMDDRKRITVLLSNYHQWLNDEKIRIEHQTNGQHQCAILTNGKGQEALFYVNGYFENGTWNAAKEKSGVANLQPLTAVA
jgi:hypothetical protein